MTEHVHEWNITGTPAMFVIACSKSNCDAELPLDEAEAMLNAAENLSANRAKIASIMVSKMPSEFGEIKDNLIGALDAYANIREGTR